MLGDLLRRRRPRAAGGLSSLREPVAERSALHDYRGGADRAYF